MSIARKYGVVDGGDAAVVRELRLVVAELEKRIVELEAGAKPRFDRAAYHKRYMRDYMRGYRSVERAKPWEAEGVSRRTWYRRKADGK